MKHSKFSTPEAIEKNKVKIIEKLESWAFTFQDEEDEEIEETNEEGETVSVFVAPQTYESINHFISKLENGKCNKEDYETIQFYLHQMNGNS